MYQRFKDEQKKTKKEVVSWSYVALGIAATFFLVAGLIWFGFFVYSYARYSAAAQIQSDIRQINKLLITIDRKCSLVDIVDNPQEITFLNNKKITSKSGLIVRYPERWSGPYSDTDFTYDGKPYMLLKKSSYMVILPSLGTELPNGAVIGKDVLVDDSMTYSEVVRNHYLTYKGVPLFYVVKGCHFTGKENVKKSSDQLSDVLPECHSAVSYARNEDDFVDSYRA